MYIRLGFDTRKDMGSKETLAGLVISYIRSMSKKVSKFLELGHRLKPDRRSDLFNLKLIY